MGKLKVPNFFFFFRRITCCSPYNAVLKEAKNPKTNPGLSASVSLVGLEGRIGLFKGVPVGENDLEMSLGLCMTLGVKLQIDATSEEPLDDPDLKSKVDPIRDCSRLKVDPP